MPIPAFPLNIEYYGECPKCGDSITDLKFWKVCPACVVPLVERRARVCVEMPFGRDRDGLPKVPKFPKRGRIRLVCERPEAA